MTLIISQADYEKLLYQAEPVQQNSSFDKFDITRRYPTLFGEGYFRHIQLRDCILLDIYNFQLHKTRVVEFPERGHPLEFQFFTVLCSKSRDVGSITGEYFLSSSGMASECAALEEESLRLVAIAIHMSPEVFRSFARNTSDELPRELQHLVKHSAQKTYERSGIQTPAMQLALQQILQCPYQDLTKKIYLENKVWELVALLIDQEIQINQGCLEIITLKPSDVDRIYHAREVLLKHLDNPPSLIELARRVGLNDCTLKQGFRQIFGTTVFGLLHNFRMELAYKLLIEGNMSVKAVAGKVGYASPTSFSNAFRKKFGVSPKSCKR